MILPLILWLRVKTPGYVAWAILFAYILIDDASMVHEKPGGDVANGLDQAPLIGLRAQDLGELVISATSDALLLLLVATFYMRSEEF